MLVRAGLRRGRWGRSEGSRATSEVRWPRVEAEALRLPGRTEKRAGGRAGGREGGIPARRAAESGRRKSEVFLA